MGPSPVGSWCLTEYESAGEAVAFWRPGDASGWAAGVPSPDLPRVRRTVRAAATSADHRPPDNTPERSLRRTRGRLRRYAVHNRLTRLVTLTYAGAGVHDFDRMRRDVAQFERRLREAYPGLASLWTFEMHPGGHGWHVHGGISEFVPQGHLARLWGHGFVDVRMVRARRGTRPGREAARLVARYVAKYAAKDAGDVPAGRQRYTVRQGCQPTVRRHVLGDSEDVARAILERLGGEVPTYRWSSSGSPGWLGPPVEYIAFG